MLNWGLLPADRTLVLPGHGVRKLEQRQTFIKMMRTKPKLTS